jgi:hypothetical protein
MNRLTSVTLVAVTRMPMVVVFEPEFPLSERSRTCDCCPEQRIISARFFEAVCVRSVAFGPWPCRRQPCGTVMIAETVNSPEESSTRGRPEPPDCTSALSAALICTSSSVPSQM